MLYIDRRPQQAIIIDHSIRVVVLHVAADVARLGINAPPAVEVHRERREWDLYGVVPCIRCRRPAGDMTGYCEKCRRKGATP